MAEQVNVYPKVKRQLSALKKQENAPSIAAARAKRIIKALVQGIRPASAGLLKRKTDKRLKNCLKFDLGSGFRLICVKEGKMIHILFMGDHDDCNTWLDNHSKKRPHKRQLEIQSYPVNNLCISIPENHTRPQEFHMADPGFPSVSQAALRRVFKGLTG